ncbi:Chemotaxis protein CheD [hydrothermal vent metagenome]|uniref:Chemotaxis protein CheD n=1 Tax=hydrothermal vent metagenome TaxID=652676 RepID=A0A3B0ZG58_9ZZZZ
MLPARPIPEGKEQPPVLRGFEHIRRYWDRSQNSFAAKILPGEYYVTRADEAVITSLGSCVSACIRDKVFGMGGMNHFMLPEAGKNMAVHAGDLTEAARYGSFAMEQLINEILKAGGRRENLEVKLVGGGQVIASMSSNVGGRNIEFAKEYINKEGLVVAGSDLGGVAPRRVVYFPATGKVRVKKLRSQEVINQERAYQDKVDHQHIKDDIELF